MAFENLVSLQSGFIKMCLKQSTQTTKTVGLKTMLQKKTDEIGKIYNICKKH
jgi:hypothetical protein